MKWFEGSIADAVTTSKRRKSIFVVFIEGKDDLSKEMASAFDQSEISDSLGSDSFVSVKLESGSESHKQFCEIYKLVPVPSVFFIGQNGSPLEIIAGAETSIATKLQAAVEKFHSNKSTTAISSPGTSGLNTSQISSQSESISVSQTPPVTKSVGEQSKDDSTAAPVSSSHSDLPLSSSEKKEMTPKPSVDIVLDNTPSSSATPVQETIHTNLPESSPSTTDVDIEEKVERAKMLLEIKKEQKKTQEEQDEKEKELERRKTGQAIMEAKRKQQDRELQELLEEKKRLKLQEQLAKQRVLDQIAQDRAERAARNAVLTLSEPTPSSSAVQSQHLQSSAAVDANTARLQFKMPNGQSRTHSFPAETTLSQVRQFIDNNIELPFREYQMATTFPRREFTSRDLSSDMRSLQLLPSAVILIMPLQGNMAVSAGPGWSRALIDMLWDLVQPLIKFSRYLQGLIWGSRDRDLNNQTNEPANNASSAQTPNPRVSASSGGRGIRKRGNIHSLTDADNSNDENNTWNGNSTQQM